MALSVSWYRPRSVFIRCRFPVLLAVLSVLACAGCELGTKVACNLDGDCFDGLSCIAGTCYECAADKAGCGCVDGSCLHGMVCSAQGICMDCSDADPCPSGLVCDAGRCVGCSSDVVGCPCEGGLCGTGLRCNERSQCEPLACADEVRNGNETDIDCGGSCSPCKEGFRCRTSTDCESLTCDDRVCLSLDSCFVRTEEFPTIQSAIDDPSCASIVLQEGVFDERVLVHRAVDIRGTPSTPEFPERTVVTNTLPGPVIEILEGPDTVHLRDLEIRNGRALRGGGVRSERDVIIESSHFIGNRASVVADWGEDEEEPIHPCGGAMFVDSADVTVRESTFVANEAEETRFTEDAVKMEASGGAICISGAGQLLIQSSEFRENLATTKSETSDFPGQFRPRTSALASGGAIHRLDRGLTEVLDSTFRDNMARTVDVFEDTFETTSAGGAISVPPVPEIADPFFELEESPVRSRIERSVFTGNVAHANDHAEGGAIHLGGAWILDSTFEHNWARSSISYSQGGAARLYGGGRLESTKFLRNRVDGTSGSGGAVVSIGSTAIVNSVFWDNAASATSGASLALLIGYESQFSVINSTFVNNGPGRQLFSSWFPSDRGTIKHSVITGGTGPCLPAGSLSSRGYNVFEQEDCTVTALAETDRIVGVASVEVGYDRASGVRAYGSGSEGVYSFPGLPLADSPLIGGGDSTGCRDEFDNIITHDARGVERTGACDIGAFAVEPGPTAFAPLTAFVLREVTPRSPEFFAADGACETNVTQVVAALINESIASDSDRLPRAECDGILDRSPVLILDSGAGPSSLMSVDCVATHVACEDPFIGFVRGKLDFRVRTDEPCSLSEQSVVVEPGDHGCIEADVTDLFLDVGLVFPFADAEFVGELGVGPHRISNGVIRGFAEASRLRDMRIPESMRGELGSEGVRDRTVHLLCAEDLVERDRRLGYYIELGVEFEEVTLYGEGLPPIRPIGCE